MPHVVLIDAVNMPTCIAWNQMNLENNNATKFNWFVFMKNKEKIQRRIALNNHLGVWHYDVIVECNTNCMSWAGHIFFKCNNHVTWSSQFFHQTIIPWIFIFFKILKTTRTDHPKAMSDIQGQQKIDLNSMQQINIASKQNKTCITWYMPWTNQRQQ